MSHAPKAVVPYAFLVALFACGEPVHENPFDPQTPPPLQAKATLQGAITLEQLGTGLPDLSGVHVSVPGAGSVDTAADGSWILLEVPAGSYTVQATKDGYVPAVLAGVVVRLDDGGSTVAVPTLALAVARGTVAGTVSLEGETASAGVTVSLSGVGGASISDALGGFTLTGIPVGQYALTASRVGFVNQVIPNVAVEHAKTTAVAPFVLAANPGSIAGSVLVVGAADSAGVTVQAEGTTLGGAAHVSQVTTGASGAFTIAPVPAGTYNVTFQKTDHATAVASVAVAPGAPSTLPPVALERDTGSVVGVATLGGSGSSAGIQISLSTPLDPTPVAAAISDAAGAWRVDGVPVGDYTISYSKTPGFLAQSGAVTVVSRSVVAALPVVLAAIPGAVRGRVTLEGVAAGALAGTVVRIEGTALSTATLADGSYLLGGMGAGTVTVVFERTGFETDRVQAVVGPGETLALFDVALLASRGAAAGTVTATGASDPSGTFVTVSGGPDTASTVTDAAGGFVVTGLRVGTGYVATYRRSAYATQTSAAFSISAGATTSVPAATLSLATTASVSGTAQVERPTGANGGIAVSLSGADVNGTPVTRSASTAASGAYSVTGLAQGTYSISFSKSGYDPQAVTGVFVASGASATHAAVTLPVAKGTVAGTVSLSAGAVAGFPVGTDLAGVVVTLSGVDVPVAATVTDPAGGYRFAGVPVSTSGGPYGVAAQKPNFLGASTSVTAIANATVTAPAMSLSVNGGALSGTVLLRDAVGGGGDNATHLGTTVSVTGTAFNGTSWSAAGSTASNGAFTIGNLPPGTFDVVAASTNRTCQAFPSVAVLQGSTATAATVRCLDALAPAAVALGTPQAPAGGQSGYTAASSVVVPIATAATDATSPASNFRGYQVVVGSTADWSAATVAAGQPATLTFAALAPNSVNTLWARAVDWIGNAGPVAATQVITDSIAPPVPVMATPRPHVNATTTSVTLSGAESDPNFAGYEVCSFSQAATVSCPVSAPGSCSWSGTSAALAVSLVANQRTCLYARAFDRAGNRSAASSIGTGGVVSDLVPPSPPTIAPAYDPTLLTVRAAHVDFFLTGASTDLPAGGPAWQNVAWLEVDTGAGFEPLCPAAACRPGDAYAPCGCGCTDERLLCNAGGLVGFRARLLEGTRNTVAVRAVDVAGNVGSGVSQQVDADSRRDILAATGAIEGQPNVRGALVGHSYWVQGGSTAGALLDLGANRRFDATDARCIVAPNTATGYGSPVFPVSSTLVATAEYSTGSRMIRPGADGLFCTGDDTSAIFRTPPAGFYVDGVSGFGERVAWWERRSGPGAANLYVREPGADGTFGNGDDVTSLVGAYNYVDRMVMGEKAMLVNQATCGDGCYTFVWRVINPSASGSWASGRTTLDLAPTVTSAALSADGRRLAWIEAGPVLKVREPGANGRFDATDDVTVSSAVPWSLSTGSQLAVDGPHVIALSSGTISWLVHWWAGPDGVFGSGDDTIERLQPTGGTRREPSISASYLAVAADNDVLGLDLSVLRWEVAPTAGLDGNHPLDVDGRGWLFYKPAVGSVVARSPLGTETTAPFTTGTYAVDRTDLIHATGSLVQLRVPDAGGNWFSPTAPAAANLMTANTISGLFLGDGKGLVLDYVFSAVRGTNVASYRILEPGTGSLSTFGTTGTVVNVLADGVRSSWAGTGAITRDQVFYVCHDWATSNVLLCVHNAGADRVFGTADDPRPATYASTVRMVHPVGSPRVGQPVSDARALRVSGRRMIVSEFSPPGIFLFDAGADGLFNTADDRGRKLTDATGYPLDVALAGDWAAYLDTGPPAGRQVWLVRGFDGVAAPITNHYSAKTAPTLEASGRAFWTDFVFVPEAVFVRAP